MVIFNYLIIALGVVAFGMFCYFLYGFGTDVGACIVESKLSFGFIIFIGVVGILCSIATCIIGGISKSLMVALKEIAIMYAVAAYGVLLIFTGWYTVKLMFSLIVKKDVEEL